MMHVRITHWRDYFLAEFLTEDEEKEEARRRKSREREREREREKVHT